jgi:hypothetical protein
MSVENVANHLSKDIPLLYTKEFTLEKGFISIENVRKSLGMKAVLFTRSFTVRKSPSVWQVLWLKNSLIIHERFHTG